MQYQPLKPQTTPRIKTDFTSFESMRSENYKPSMPSQLIFDDAESIGADIETELHNLPPVLAQYPSHKSKR